MNFETPACRFTLDRIHFENEASRKGWRHFNHVISLHEFSSNRNPKWSVNFASRLLNTVADATETNAVTLFFLHFLFNIFVPLLCPFTCVLIVRTFFFFFKPLQLSNTKTSDNKSTLLHFLVQSIESKYPEVLNIKDEIPSVSTAAKGKI